MGSYKYGDVITVLGAYEFKKILEDNKINKLVFPLYTISDKHYIENSLSLIVVFYDLQYRFFNFNHPDLDHQYNEAVLREIKPTNTGIYDYRYFHRWWSSNEGVFDLELRRFESKNFYNYNRVEIAHSCGGVILSPVKFLEEVQNFIYDIGNDLNRLSFNSLSTYERIWRNIIEMEYNGITINPHLSADIIGVNRKKIYTNYNPYTQTLRPSNSYNGFNYLAMNKKDGTREMIIPGNDFLVEFDYSGSHLEILKNLIHLEKTNTPIHLELARIYYNKDEISYEEYSNSKKITFKYLYGADEITGIQFFEKVNVFLEKKYEEYQHSEINNIIDFDINIRYGEIPKNIFLNYHLQTYEALYCISKIGEINRKLKNKKTKLILYVYDSFLIDYSKEDGSELLYELYEIISKDLPASVKMGKTYGRLNNFEI